MCMSLRLVYSWPALSHTLRLRILTSAYSYIGRLRIGQQVLICLHHCGLLGTCVIHGTFMPYCRRMHTHHIYGTVQKLSNGCLATACISLLPGGYFTNSYADSIRHSHNGFPRLILGSSLDELLKERDPVPYSK